MINWKRLIWRFWNADALKPETHYLWPPSMGSVDSLWSMKTKISWINENLPQANFVGYQMTAAFPFYDVVKCLLTGCSVANFLKQNYFESIRQFCRILLTFPVWYIVFVYNFQLQASIYLKHGFRVSFWWTKSSCLFKFRTASHNKRAHFELSVGKSNCKNT